SVRPDDGHSQRSRRLHNQVARRRLGAFLRVDLCDHVNFRIEPDRIDVLDFVGPDTHQVAWVLGAGADHGPAGHADKAEGAVRGAGSHVRVDQQAGDLLEVRVVAEYRVANPRRDRLAGDLVGYLPGDPDAAIQLYIHGDLGQPGAICHAGHRRKIGLVARRT